VLLANSEDSAKQITIILGQIFLNMVSGEETPKNGHVSRPIESKIECVGSRRTLSYFEEVQNIAM